MTYKTIPDSETTAEFDVEDLENTLDYNSNEDDQE